MSENNFKIKYKSYDYLENSSKWSDVTYVIDVNEDIIKNLLTEKQYESMKNLQNSNEEYILEIKKSLISEKENEIKAGFYDYSDNKPFTTKITKNISEKLNNEIENLIFNFDERLFKSDINELEINFSNSELYKNLYEKLNNPGSDFKNRQNILNEASYYIWENCMKNYTNNDIAENMYVYNNKEKWSVVKWNEDKNDVLLQKRDENWNRKDSFVIACDFELSGSTGEISINWKNGTYLDNINKEEALKYFDKVEKNNEKKDKSFVDNIYTMDNFGYNGIPFQIETVIKNGNNETVFNGLYEYNEKENAEEKTELLKNSIANQGYNYPSDLLKINLNSLNEENPDYKFKNSNADLGIALSIIKSRNKNVNESRYTVDDKIMAIGSLDKNGNVYPVNYAYQAAEWAKKNGIKYIICHEDNFNEIKTIEGISFLTVKNLTQAVELSKDVRNMNEIFHINHHENNEILFNEEYISELKKNIKLNDLENIFDPQLIKAIEVSIAGKHNLKLVGKPGNGKTAVVMDFIKPLTPLLTEKESEQVKKMYSTGFGNKESIQSNYPTLNSIPFRIPEQNSQVKYIYGSIGPYNVIGEVNLSHRGVLFLDEMAEFKKDVLDSVKGALNEGYTRTSWAGNISTVPSKFQLITCSCTCACGNHGTSNCYCSPNSINLYNKKTSVFDDKTEIQVYSERNENNYHKIDVDKMIEHIKNAYDIQRERHTYNTNLSGEKLEYYFNADEKAKLYIENIAENYSVNEIQNAKKVAITLANMEGRERIEIEDVKEALSLSQNVINHTDNSVKKNIYFREKNEEIENLKNQKSFLENSNETFKKSVDNITSKKENNSLSQIEKKLNNINTDNLIEEVHQNVNQIKKVNQNLYENTKRKTRSK